MLDSSLQYIFAILPPLQDMLPPPACVLYSAFTRCWGFTSLAVFIKVLTFAAAVKVACEHWVLLDQGVINPEACSCERL